MPRSQLASSRRRSPAFRNRCDQRRLFAREVAQLRIDPDRLTVLGLVGLGGSGKTRLLNELQKSARKGRSIRHIVKVSLATESWATETGPLLRLRDQIAIDCLLFDAALITYWSATGQRFPAEHTYRLARSPLLQSVELGSNVVGLANPFHVAVDFAVPVRFAVDAWEALTHQYKRHRRYSKNDFKAIDELREEPEELRTRLPGLLGLDVQRRLEATDRPFVAFYDGYERQRPETVAEDAPWLRDFIRKLDRGLHVIATREPLGWPAADWDTVVHDVPVDRLPEPEARELLRERLGRLPPAIEDHLLQASDRIPFYLETVSSSYAALTTGDNRVELTDLPASPDEALPNLISHLPREQRRLAVAMAAVQVFDETLFRYLVHGLNLQVDIFEFGPFTRRYFVEEISTGLHKTHDLLTASVRDADEEPVRRASLELATRHLLMLCQDAGVRASDTVLALFLAVLAGWRYTNAMGRESVEALVDAGYLLYDAGYWNQLASIAHEQAVSVDGHPVAVVAEFFSALAARRVTGIGRAIKLFERLQSLAPALGRHARSLQLEVAYLRELDGDYAFARDAFARLNPAGESFDPDDRTQLRARLWHADILTMDGALRPASQLLAETYDADTLKPLDRAELVRHRAHALRFSFALDEAEALYDEALRSAGDTLSMQGKLYTNLVETRCWRDPERALSAATVAQELNTRLGSKIELAKCKAAQAIALAKLGRRNAACAAIAAADDQACAIGYRAGVAFARQAEAVAAGLAGDADGLQTAYGRLREVVGALGTYGHLLVAPASMIDDIAFLEAAINVDWVEEELLENRLGTYLRPAM
jgi:tetratricopeptide (TPR) repeat protein